MGKKNLYLLAVIHLLASIVLFFARAIEKGDWDGQNFLAMIFLAAGMLWGVLGIIASKGR